MKKALKISDRAYLLVSSKVAFVGPSKELYIHPKLGKSYLKNK